MMIDTKYGFILTYFKTSQQGEDMLRTVVKTLSRENYYIVLASHSVIPSDISLMCDFSFYEELNIIDNKKYSHGVAESNLIEISLNHLKYKNIKWTYKMSYDVDILDVSHFDNWIKNKEYQFVSCNWGDNFICTHSFFANIDFLMKNIKFYKSINDMFSVSNTLENCWQKNIEDNNLYNYIYSFDNKESFFGKNKIDLLFHDYNNVDFWFDENELKFYIQNNGNEYNYELRIFDYYTDLCIYVNNTFQHPKGVTMWIVPPNESLLRESKNGFYMEIYFKEGILRKNINIQDFEDKDEFSNKFKLYKDKEVKFNEYCDFNDFKFYSEFNIDIPSIRNFVDVGACYGFASLPFLKKNVKTYLIDADTTNIELLNLNFGKNRNIKVIHSVIGDIDGIVDFYIEEGLSVVSSIFCENALGGSQNRKKIKTNSITPNFLIEEYINEEYIDLMKIDIEGSEYDFFKTISNKNLNKIKSMIIEYHNNDDYQVLSILEKLGENDFFFKIKSYWEEDNEYPVESKMGIIYAYKK